MNSKIRTDLAIENREFYKNAKNLNEEIPGIETTVDDSDEDLKITTVKVQTAEASEILRSSNRHIHNNRIAIYER